MGWRRGGGGGEGRKREKEKGEREVDDRKGREEVYWYQKRDGGNRQVLRRKEE
jgi:hypothetical protein